jgi:hypothetical protein
VGITSEFSISDSPCAHRRDPAIEQVLQGVVKVSAARPPKTGSVATLEMRNVSGKSIAAYVLTYTVVRGQKTEYSGAFGKDLADGLALVRYSRKAAPPNTTLLPGETYRAEIWSGRYPGHFEAYPCMVVFDDGTSIGPPQVLRSVTGMRQTRAKSLGNLIADLELARDSADPKATLLLRAKRSTRIESSGVANGHTTRTSSPGWGSHLEYVASQLSGSASSPRDRKILADHISVFRAQQEGLLEAK